MRPWVLIIAATVCLAANAPAAERPSLFPNGGAENVFLNDIEQLPSYASRIHPTGRNHLPLWDMTSGAEATDLESYAGRRSVRLTGGTEDVKATVRSDFWTVKDSRIPFGLPLAPGEDIEISFVYKTAGLPGEQAFHAEIRLGTVRDRSSEIRKIELPPSETWTSVRETMQLEEWAWGAEVAFILPAGSENIAAWVDEVCLRQEIEGVNLVRNPGFEEELRTPGLPPEWGVPTEDQWVSWVGASYRLPEIDAFESASGRKALRASVVYTEGSGVSQRIRFLQKEARPIVLSAKSKLDNSIGNSPPGYWGPDNLANLTVFVYFDDGTMQEVSPTFSLGVSDHDWDYRRFGFLPLRPVEEIEVRVTVLGSEPTTTLWMDDIRAFEWKTTPSELDLRGVDIPPPVLTSVWGEGKTDVSPGKIHAANDETHLFLSVPKRAGEETFIYLNPRVKSDFINHERFLYTVIRVDENGGAFLGTVVEKQGYTADGLYAAADTRSVRTKDSGAAWGIAVPFSVLELDGASEDPFGFNIRWAGAGHESLWSGRTVNAREMGRIDLARPPAIRVKSVLFGKRYFDEADQSQDFVSHPQTYAGRNEAEIVLANETGRPRETIVRAGVSGGKISVQSVRLEAGETRAVTVLYDAGLKPDSVFNLALEEDGRPVFLRSYPLMVPAAIEIVLDQDHYLPDETAHLEIHNRFRPIPDKGKARMEIRDLVEGKTLRVFERDIADALTTVAFEIEDLRINSHPVQDYEVEAVYLDVSSRELGRGRARFGRIRPTQRRPLPDIRTLELDNNGFIVINGDFRFFPIVPSVNVMDWDDALKLGANVFRGSYTSNGPQFEDRDKAWAVNAYTLTIGPGSPHPGDPDILKRFASEAEDLLVHPGFLSCYGKQFYYWRLTPEDIAYRKKLEDIVAGVSSPRLVIWGHHDSSFLYDREGPDWEARPRPPVGYCYVKIMGRPGSAWRNAPFLTRTETVLNPGRFRLAEVNYYVSFHADEVVPEQYPGYLSLRGDDWRGFRAESYLSVIYGANGLYHWICTQKHQLQRLRGWFQEMNAMWPVFAALDSGRSVAVKPVSGRIETRLKSWDGKLYLLAALAGEETTEAEITVPGISGMKVRKLFDVPGQMQVDGDTIRDVWNKYDVHVYEIEAPAGTKMSGPEGP